MDMKLAYMILGCCVVSLGIVHAGPSVHERTDALQGSYDFFQERFHAYYNKKTRTLMRRSLQLEVRKYAHQEMKKRKGVVIGAGCTALSRYALGATVGPGSWPRLVLALATYGVVYLHAEHYTTRAQKY